MKKHRTVRFIIIGFVSVAYAQLEHKGIPDNYPYYPAFISTISSPPGHTELVVFPHHAKSFKIPVRDAAGVVFGPNGTELYGACTPYPAIGDERLKVAVCKIDLNTGSTVPVPGSTDIRGYYAYSVSKQENRILFLGSSRILDLSLPDGKIRTTVVTHVGNAVWTYPSLSPDGERAVATHNSRVALIDIASGTTKPLGEEFFIAAWSPDGKWLAAVEQGEDGRTILMDAKTLKRVKILGPSELDWSPYSRYLLGLKSCDEFYGTLEAINVETGERTTIESSKCQINQATTGWVASDITRK